MTERHQVEIDYCPSCRGVWLDKGELDKLLQFASTQNSQTEPSYEERPAANRGFEQSERYTDSRDSRDYQRDSREYPQKYPRKKKSFLSDFFDFD